MTWIKLDDTLPNNPKILPLGDKAFRLYIEGLCYANQYLTDGFLAEAVVDRLDPELANTELVEAGLWKKANGGFQIHDYTKHQSSRQDVQEKREQVRDRVTRYRDKSNADVTLPETEDRKQNTDTEAFAAFWSVYPLKVGKGAALKAYLKAVRRASPDEILSGAQRYADDPNRNPGYTAHASTWLNADRWQDEALPKKPTGADLRLEQAPTPTPPRFTADDALKGAPMPESIRRLFNRELQA
jgi:hypothetical protein